MTDLELTRLCAEKMGLVEMPEVTDTMTYRTEGAIWANGGVYRPLTNDAQAMALVVKFRLRVLPQANGHWCADNGDPTPFVCGGYFLGQGDTPNRAICECVAKLP